MTTEQKYIEHLEKSFEKAERKESKLIQEIHDIPGMTGEMTRHFYNNLLSIDGAIYLEIGVWSGSSSCSAMYGNNAKVVLMDDFSAFGGPKEIFISNYEKYKGDNEATFIEADCFKIDPSILKYKFNIYLFDGDHSAHSQFMALDYYLPCLADVFIYIADDWNFKEVREGTNLAIAENFLQVIWKKEIRLTDNDEHTPPEEAKESFHNGIGVFILKKKS